MNFKRALLYAVIFSVAFLSCEKDSQLDTDKKDIKSYLNSKNISYEEKSNIYYSVITEGTGEQCKEGDTIAIKYKVCLMNDERTGIDSSLVKAETYYLPTTIPTAVNDGLIPGVQIGLTTMREGGKSELYIPSGYAYGAKEIKGETYANLIFYVELCEIKHHDSKH